MNLFGETLLSRREALGISQAELARRLNLNHSTVSRWERAAGRGVRFSTGEEAVLPDDIERIALALHQEDPDPNVIEADIYLLSVSAGFLPPGGAGVLRLPVIAAIAMAWDGLTLRAREDLEFEVGAALDRAMELSNE